MEHHRLSNKPDRWGHNFWNTFYDNKSQTQGNLLWWMYKYQNSRYQRVVHRLFTIRGDLSTKTNKLSVLDPSFDDELSIYIIM